MAIDYDQVVATGQIMTMLQSVLAEAICKDIQRDDIHAMVDEIYDEFERMACDDYNET